MSIDKFQIAKKDQKDKPKMGVVLYIIEFNRIGVVAINPQ